MEEVEGIVFVVEDDASLRRSTERLLRSRGFAVQAFVSADEFLRSSPTGRPACLILDVQLPGLDGLELQAELARTGVEIPIIFTTGHGDIPMTVRAMKAGAVEFLIKPVATEALVDAIRGAIERDRMKDDERRHRDRLQERYRQLTQREREVMALVVAGLLNKQIAFKLETSERTVKFHRAHVMQKMAAESVADLVRLASQLGLAATP